MEPKWLRNGTQNGAQIGSGGQLEGKLSAGNLADPLAGTYQHALQLKEFSRAPRGRGVSHLDK